MTPVIGERWLCEVDTSTWLCRTFPELFATVEIENTHRNMSEKKPLVRAILDSAQQVATPAFVSTLSICLVFTPVVL
jgi:hypothetical protein